MFKSTLCALLLIAGVLFCSAQEQKVAAPGATASPAPQARAIASPRDSVMLMLDTNMISVNYGRPSKRGRTIMGGLVPWNQVWRTGANQATHLRSNFDMTMGGQTVPKGLFTLWTLPSQNGWKIIINKQTGQWGTNYDERQDFTRFDATVEQLPAPVDTFTVALEKSGPVSGRLILSWENTRVWVPFEKNDHIRPLSPPDSSTARINGKAVKIKYSKPFMRGRTIWGVVVPFDSVWRTGANSPTTLVTEGPLSVGTVRLKPGTYILQTLPKKESLTLIISRRSPGQGEGPVPDSLTVGKAVMTMSAPSAPIDPFRIRLTPKDAGSAVMTMGWADREYQVVIAQ